MKSNKINVFMDTEFNYKYNELISLALVSENGDIYYKVSNEWMVENSNDFVRSTVIPMLPDKKEWISIEQIKKELQSFILNLGKKVELWGWYCSYDMFLLHKLFRSDLHKLPFWLPKYINDFRGLIERDSDYRFSPNKFFSGQKHIALNDAIALRDAFIAREQYRKEVEDEKNFKLSRY